MEQLIAIDGNERSLYFHQYYSFWAERGKQELQGSRRVGLKHELLQLVCQLFFNHMIAAGFKTQPA